MPVRKFRDVGDMEATLWRPVGDTHLAAAIARVWDFARRTCDRRFPPGVYEHRSIEDAQELRDAWDEKCFREYWARQRRAGAPAPHPQGSADEGRPRRA